ncbi:MAG: zf-HC2 domain-containing protein [Gracilibacteraceae bacterium]|jgi:predicted anti-sigma-YlaC factor YlaD|nr:zf-HC2 domain-containing protein [Gracilibacteraceae bacterium]
MKMSCEIIKDLLPLYLDGVCSNDSKAAVEDHLLGCDKCQAELRAMQKPLPLDRTEQNLDEAEAVKNLSRRWKKGMNKSLLKGVLLTIAAIAAIALVLYLFMDIRAFPNPY